MSFMVTDTLGYGRRLNCAVASRTWKKLHRALAGSLADLRRFGRAGAGAPVFCPIMTRRVKMSTLKFRELEFTTPSPLPRYLGDLRQIPVPGVYSRLGQQSKGLIDYHACSGRGRHRKEKYQLRVE